MARRYSEAEKQAASAAALLDVLEQSRPGSKYWRCPSCGREGLYKPGEGAGYAGRWRCFYCQAGGDAANALALRQGIPVGEALKQIMEQYGGAAVDAGPRVPARKVGEDQRVVQPDGWAEVCRASCLQWAAALPGSEGERYMASRGIDAEMRRAACLGYNGHGVVIPYSKKLDYYCIRYIRPFVGDGGRVVRMSVPSVADAGPEPIYNAGAVMHSDWLFVVEGQVDALSVLQAVRHGGLAGVGAVATCGPVASKKLVALLKMAAEAGRCGRVMIAADADDAGQISASALSDQLVGAGVQFVQVDVQRLYAGRKDANDALQLVGSAGLASRLRESIEKADENGKKRKK